MIHLSLEAFLQKDLLKEILPGISASAAQSVACPDYTAFSEGVQCTGRNEVVENASCCLLSLPPRLVWIDWTEGAQSGPGKIWATRGCCLQRVNLFHMVLAPHPLDAFGISLTQLRERLDQGAS